MPKISSSDAHRASKPALRHNVTLRFAAPVLSALALAGGLLLSESASATTASSHVWLQRAIKPHAVVVPKAVSLYPTSTVPADSAEPDGAAVELGVRFSVATAGTISAIKYYKSRANSGLHTATLWTKSGQKLATATFTHESVSGWQTATLSRPVSVQPATTYVASYHTNTGHYAQQENAFNSAGAGLSNAYLAASSGVYVYGRGGFPRDTWNRSAYYVDVDFNPATLAPPVADPSPAPSTSNPTPAPTTSSPAPGPTTSSPTPAPSTSTPAPAPTTSSPAPVVSTPPPTSGKMTVHPNAGVPAGTTLTTYTGPSTITTNGTVIDGKSIPFGLRIEAQNVVITRSSIRGSDGMGIQVDGSLTITQSTISGFSDGIGGDNYTANLLEVTKLKDDGFKLGSNVHVDHSWCHDMAPEAGAHADCGQMQAGEVNLSVTNSWFDGGSNSALFIAPDLGPSSNGPVTISGNVLGNGNYTLFCVDGNNGQYFVKNIAITNNQFLKSSQYGPDRINVPVTASGNTWFGTNTAVSMN